MMMDKEGTLAMERLLILFAAPTPEAGQAMIASAMAQAAAPGRLTFGAAVEDSTAAPFPHADRLRCCKAATAWEAWQGLWRGEQLLVMAHPGLRFTRNWDVKLLRLLHRLGQHAALTGIPCTPGDETDAPRPVAFRGFDPQGLIVPQPGVPLTYAKAPLRSALLNESFCCGFVPFFRALNRPELPLFLQAFAADCPLYTLHRAIVWEQAHPPLPAYRVSDAEEALLERFRKSYMTDLRQRQLSAMSRTGLFTPDLDYPRHVPPAVRLQERLRGLRFSKAFSPLPVTVLAQAGLDPDRLPEESLRCFSLLCGVRALPLLCFADGSLIRRALPLSTNVLEWKEKYLLPQTEGDPLPERIALSKIRMLAHAKEKMLHHSHYIWIDPAYRDAAIAPGAAVDWSWLCTDRVVMGLVNGEPDPSMIAVPAQLLLGLGQAIEQLLAERAAPMTERALWTALTGLYPAWFDLRALPDTHRLLGLALTPRGVAYHTLAGETRPAQGVI